MRFLFAWLLYCRHLTDMVSYKEKSCTGVVSEIGQRGGLNTEKLSSSLIKQGLLSTAISVKCGQGYMWIAFAYIRAQACICRGSSWSAISHQVGEAIHY